MYVVCMFEHRLHSAVCDITYVCKYIFCVFVHISTLKEPCLCTAKAVKGLGALKWNTVLNTDA